MKYLECLGSGEACGNSKLSVRKHPATQAPSLPGKSSFFFLLDTPSDWDYHILISLDASELGGKWNSGVSARSLLRDLESYYCIVLAFCDLLFNVVVYMELKNI